jgi:flagellar hook-basal body complex protein FliE
MAVEGIEGLSTVASRPAYRLEENATPAASFADTLRKAVADVNNLQAQRDEMVEGMVAGEVSEVHDVMVAAEEAQLAFELLLEVRNRLLESYQEIMRMQV